VIVVVEDDESVRCALGHLLRAAAFDAVTFASAEEFLSSPDDDRVDCLIADINLPGMSGAALVQALGAAARAIPAILISAGDDNATLELVRRAGAPPYLRKPFSDEELFAAISQVLQG
jgi:FixJ family two-component response regulator